MFLLSSSGCGARNHLARTSRRKRGSRQGSVARALGVQSRENLANNPREVFRPARAKQMRSMEAPQVYTNPPSSAVQLAPGMYIAQLAPGT